MHFTDVRLLQLALAAGLTKLIITLNYQSILEILKSFVLDTKLVYACLIIWSLARLGFGHFLTGWPSKPAKHQLAQAEKPPQTS